jgi:hypothetical protein
MQHTGKPWNMGVLKVKENGRYLMNGNTPFFWMGDTAWLLFQKLNLEEARIYLKNRKEKGFNIILADFIHNEDQTNLSGSRAMIENEFGKPDLEGDYWSHVDQVIHMAEEMGLYMGILPVWGSSIIKGGALNMNNVDTYVHFIAERYQDYPNLVWILGGDVRGDVNEAVVDRMGELLRKLNPDKLIGYHPFGRTSSSIWHHNKRWLDFNMFQSGHRRYDQACLGAWDDNAVKEEYYGEDSWRYVQRDYAKLPPKPTIDGEPSYEHILQGLHDETQPYWQPADVRRYAYWSVFAGAFGHTYGDNSIMQFFREGEKKGAFGVKDTWETGLHHPGSSHMSHLCRLMSGVDFTRGHAAEDLLVGEQQEKYEYLSIFAGENFIFCYNYSGKPFTLKLSEYQDKIMEAYWLDPETGIKSFIGEITHTEYYKAVVPVKAHDKDYVLAFYQKNKA